MFNANVYTIFIASPSDVKDERQAVENALLDWNSTNSEHEQCVLLPVMYERDAYPATGQPPQTTINHQCLEKCDFLIGIFWSKIGTKTTDYQSGTIEEISKHCEAGKPAMLYFCKRDIPQSSCFEQYTQLQDYKKSVQNNSFYREFFSVEELKNIFSKDLGKLVLDHIQKGDGFLENNKFNSQSISDSSKDENPKDQLTDEAKTLLITATEDQYGIIIKNRTQGKSQFQTNNKGFGDKSDGRISAIWDDAFQVLLRLDLIVPQGSRGELFYVTKKGYDLADSISKDGYQIKSEQE